MGHNHGPMSAQTLTAPQGAAPPLPPIDPPRNRRALCLAVAVFSAMSLWMAVASKGFLEADSCTHYMEARHAIDEPGKFAGVWGRPLCTGSYAIPAVLGGVLGVRVMSLLMALACGLITYRIARVQGYRRPAIAAILLFAQPLFFMHSFSELTEIPFALVAVAALWAYQARQFLVMAILAGVSPTGRPEGFFLIALAALALIAHRRWWWLLVLPVPLMLWSYGGWVSFGRPPTTPWWRWLQEQWPYAAESAYGRGPWLHFVGLLPALVSPFVVPLLFPGVWLSIRDPIRRFLSDHRARVQLAIVGIPLTILVVHTLLWRFGKMASNGELRYLLAVAPMWALVCARGWEWAWPRFRLPAPFLCAGLAATGPIFANVYYKVVPLRLYNEDYACAAAADWYRDTPGLAKQYPRVMASPTRIYFMLDRSASDKAVSVDWGKVNVADAPPGVVLFWDDIYGLTNSNRDLIVPREDIDRAGWIPAGTISYLDKTVYAYLSPKTVSGDKTDAKRFPTPGETAVDLLHLKDLGRRIGEVISAPAAADR